MFCPVVELVSEVLEDFFVSSFVMVEESSSDPQDAKRDAKVGHIAPASMHLPMSAKNSARVVFSSGILEPFLLDVNGW